MLPHFPHHTIIYNPPLRFRKISEFSFPGVVQTMDNQTLSSQTAFSPCTVHASKFTNGIPFSGMSRRKKSVSAQKYCISIIHILICSRMDCTWVDAFQTLLSYSFLTNSSLERVKSVIILLQRKLSTQGALQFQSPSILPD